MAANIKVVVRVRPMNDRELGRNDRSVIEIVDENRLVFDPKENLQSQEKGQPSTSKSYVKRANKGNKDLTFAFGSVCGPNATNQDVFKSATKADMVAALMEGYNSSVFAYGATGAGKSHTMTGSAEQPGLAHLMVEHLFQTINGFQLNREFDIAASYIEVYNENIFDLLKPSSTPLQLRGVNQCGVTVAGLSVHKIRTAQELLAKLELGNRNRTRRPGGAHAESSCSHAVFQVYVTMRHKESQCPAADVKLSMVDLAGERPSARAGAGRRAALRLCITKLADGNAFVPYRCRIPECESSRPEIAVSWWPATHVDHCSKPVLNSTFVEDGLCSNFSFTDAVEECTDWIYENNNTVYSMLNLACHPWKLSLIGAVHNIGMALAMLIAGWMADRFGRKPVIIVCSVGCFIGNLKTLATSYPVYISLEFLESAICGGAYTAGSVLMIEIGNKKNRMLAGVLFAYAIYMGEAVFAVIAMLVPYWKTLIHIICSPTLLFLSYILLVRESPRWQILNGRTEPVKDTLKLIVKTNKLNVKIEDIDNLDEEKLKSTYKMESSATKEGFREVFKCREILKRFLVATFCRFTVTFIYYGLMINSVWLPGNKYTNFLLAAIMSFPGELMSMYMMNKVGRKKPLIFGYLICGITCVACGFVPESISWLKISLFLIGKLLTSACYTGIVTYTMELFPTSVRGSLLGLCTLASSVGNMVAPLTPVLSSISPALASVCFGCTAAVASGLLILTPETRDLPLMDTIDQVARSMAIEKTTKDNKTPIDNQES